MHASTDPLCDQLGDHNNQVMQVHKCLLLTIHYAAWQVYKAASDALSFPPSKHLSLCETSSCQRLTLDSVG